MQHLNYGPITKRGASSESFPSSVQPSTDREVQRELIELLEECVRRMPRSLGSSVTCRVDIVGAIINVIVVSTPDGIVMTLVVTSSPERKKYPLELCKLLGELAVDYGFTVDKVGSCYVVLLSRATDR